MKYQIISRAFYGWLAYCRHLSTVRTHLSALVNHSIVDRNTPSDARGGLSVEVWSSFLQDCSNYQEQDIYRLVYFGGVAPTLRKEVWPFLLGHYHFTMTEKSRMEVDENMQTAYRANMKQWQGCEAIVHQREREKHTEALARCSSGASAGKGPLKRDSTISTDSSQTSSSGHQNARSQSDSSSSTQVFGSVEDMDQMESEPRSEEGKSRIPVKDVKGDTADSQPLPPGNLPSVGPSDKLQDLDKSIFVSGSSIGSTVSQLLPSSAELSGEGLSKEAMSGSEISDVQPSVHQSQGKNVSKTTAPKDNSDETEGSESEKFEEIGVSEINITAQTEVKGSESEPLNTSKLEAEEVVSKETASGVNPVGKTQMKVEPENMNVLKLEKEVHNQYFQAPLLGQTLAIKAQEGKDLPLTPLCLHTRGEIIPDHTEPDKLPDKATSANEPEGEDTDADISELSEPKKDKPGEFLHDKRGSDSPVRQVLNALQSASRGGSMSLSSHCKQSSDTADSDDSPSALEMEDIPTGITCMTSEDSRPSRTLMTLAAPPLSHIRMRALDRPASAPVLDTGSNTSPDGTDAGLSEEEEEEEEPEMESLPTRQVPVEEAVVNPEDLSDHPLSSSAESAYTQEQLDMYLLNLHRIDKDVRRCDGRYWYFTPDNLEKLRNIMCSCFSELMKRMNQNFPHGGAMDSHFANMRSLI
ncbi:hypothetical protein CRUP_001154, partial [Coryphaenoides rupestris]